MLWAWKVDRVMIEVYTCYHKPFFTPQSDILVPIQVGKSRSNVDLNITSDNTGDNISEKNPHFCELTATYWIWKNSKADVVGLFHYRRFLNFVNEDTCFNHFDNDFCSKYGITSDNINFILSDYDLILPKIKHKRKCNASLYEQYNSDHVGTDMDCVLQVIDERYPEMAKVAHKVIKEGKETYSTNILICRKDIFDKYASWLFGVLFEVEKRIHHDVLLRDAYQQRVYGFLAERMMTIFVKYMQEAFNLKVKELPSLYFEDDDKRWRIYCLRSIKRKIFKFLRIRR